MVNRHIRPDLSGADLNGLDLLKTDFARAKLQDCNFNGANLIGADLTFATSPGAHFVQADLFYALLRYADLTGSDITKAGRALEGSEGAATGRWREDEAHGPCKAPEGHRNGTGQSCQEDRQEGRIEGRFQAAGEENRHRSRRTPRPRLRAPPSKLLRPRYKSPWNRHRRRNRR